MRQQPGAEKPSVGAPVSSQTSTDTVALKPVPLPKPKGPVEETLRLNNLGIAAMEQFHFAKAAEYFRQARAKDPEFLPAAANLGIALFYDRKNTDAEQVLRDVVKQEPEQIESRFVLALLERAAGKDASALKELKMVLNQDPKDAAALYLAGSLEAAQHYWDEAILHFRSALVRDPFNVSTLYALAKALIQKGEAGEAEKTMARFQELKARGSGTNFGNQYLEQGRYAQAIRVSGPGEFPDTGGLSPRPHFVDLASASGISFVHSGPQNAAVLRAAPFSAKEANRAELSPDFIASFGSGAAFLDFDRDGWPDLFLVNASAHGPASSALYRNNRDGTFRLVPSSVLEYHGMGMGVAAGDYDNDGRPDLFIAGFKSSALYHNERGGRFRQVTPILSPKLQQSWALSAAFVDLDHDGDLDLFVTCAEYPRPNASLSKDRTRNLLFRNNGNGTFTETGNASGISGGGFTASLVTTDFNGSRDIDLLLVGLPWKLFSNKRDGSFADVTLIAGLDAPGGPLGSAVGDFDGDGGVDICGPSIANDESVRFYWNQGGTFRIEEVSTPTHSPFWSALALDYDNDGDLDVLLIGNELHLLENKGHRRFDDVTASVGLNTVKAANARSVAAVDYDQDGDLDLLVTRCGFAPLLLRNDGGNRNHSWRLTLEGKADNRLGIGSKIEWAAGGLWQHREVDGNLGYLSQSSGEILLGLGRHEAPDYVRVLWPSGVLQTEVPPKESSRLHLVELDRKGTSCPILYAWDGEQYRFVTDFLGGSAMGYLVAPGRYVIPDTDEYVKICHDQLQPHNNRVSLKMVNQLEEVILFDMVRLLAVDHPPQVEIFPNERLLSHPPFPEFRVFTASSPRNIVSAVDDKNRPWTEALRSLDRNYVKGFRLLPYKGYADEHGLTLDLGDLRGASRALLLLDGWIDYATSTSNFAAAQTGLKLVAPYLQVWDRGKWQTVLDDMGFPAGLPKTMIVDLTGKIAPLQQTRIRIITNMRIYWDRIRLETGPADSRVRLSTLRTAEAKTSWVGYPQQWSPDGRAPFYYDYAHRDATAPWKTHIGNYIRLGDAQDLLRTVDDRYVVLSHGEAITAEFWTDGLPSLPAGWTRDWLLHVDGFGKDMDLHSAHPDTVAPLPRHRELR